jgi:CheY-like chemotaxis protein
LLADFRFLAVSTDIKTDLQKRAYAREAVLVVVDEVLIRMVIADYLRQCGYRVIEASNSDEAIIVLEHPESRVDVVFTTIEMPGSRDGFALSHWVREHRPGVEVVLAGSLARAANSAGELCEKGPHGKKPYETTSIIAEVSQLLAASKRQNPATGL